MRNLNTSALKAFILLFFLSSCSEETTEEQSRDKAVYDLATELHNQMKINKSEQEKLALIHYHLLSDQEKEAITPEQYHQQYIDAYKRVVKATKENLYGFSGATLNTDIQEFRETLKEKERIPDWYWNARQKGRNKLSAISRTE